MHSNATVKQWACDKRRFLGGVEIFQRGQRKHGIGTSCVLVLLAAYLIPQQPYHIPTGRYAARIMIGSSPTLMSKRRRAAGGVSVSGTCTGDAVVLLGSRVPPPTAIADNDDDNDNDVGIGNDDCASIHSISSSIDTSDDLASLQSIDDSICACSRSEVLEQQQHEALMREAERTLVTAIGTSDPTSALLEYYQSLDKGRGKNKGENNSNNGKPKQPTYRDIQHRNERGIITGWWRSVLHCPVLDREYPSGLPWSVWLTHACMSDADDT